MPNYQTAVSPLSFLFLRNPYACFPLEYLRAVIFLAGSLFHLSSLSSSPLAHNGILAAFCRSLTYQQPCNAFISGAWGIGTFRGKHSPGAQFPWYLKFRFHKFLEENGGYNSFDVQISIKHSPFSPEYRCNTRLVEMSPYTPLKKKVSSFCGNIRTFSVKTLFREARFPLNKDSPPAVYCGDQNTNRGTHRGDILSNQKTFSTPLSDTGGLYPTKLV